VRLWHSTIVTAVLAILALAVGTDSIAGASESSEPMQPSYSEVVGQLQKASVPLRLLDGRIAITLAAGRVVALAFSPEGPNLLWSNPQLGDTDTVREHPEKLVGGFGGDRLWFAPELAYNWEGKPDWASFGNYKTPRETDPGSYQFLRQDSHSITLQAKGELPVHGAPWRVGFEVRRSIRATPPPVPVGDPLMQGVDYVGIESSHELKIAPGTHTGRIDLWHLLQMPVGSVLIVPRRATADPRAATPLSYGLPGGWIEKPDHLMWRFGGEARAKVGLPALALTGRSALLRQLEAGRWCLIVRQFPTNPNAQYADHPYGVPRSDQVFQAWDGFGFGEMEYHSPVLDAASGPRELREADQLWAFGGTPKAIAALASRLLGVDITYVIAR
jgi:hypothetical protein